uniref:Scavenger receptor class B member 1 n=1 Tax=Photinus pyralis TaxID=7054 RepID=A0A1Y1K1C6_PHOPY
MRPFSQRLRTMTCYGLIGTFLFTSGVLLLLLWSWLLDVLTASMLVLKPDGALFEVWRKPPMTLALDFYFFNWTNPEEINSKKPKFTEMGPYRFTELREKVNLVWNENDTITYQQLRRWNFDAEFSSGRLTDSVTTLNAVTMSAAHHIKDWNYFMKRGFSHTLSAVAPNAHIVKTVGELLFDGYDDPLVDIAATFPFLSTGIPSFDKFGWFYTRNNSDTFDGVFNMGTGVQGDFGQLKTWNYENETNYYSGECAKVHGSGAEFYTKPLKKDYIGFFSPDMCRYVQLDYEEDKSLSGISGYKYSAQAGMLDNGTLRPENECFCNGDCVPSGMLNVSSCRYGTPAFVSLPHFYGADPTYLSRVEGLHPEKDKHEMYITLEPVSSRK